MRTIEWTSQFKRDFKRESKSRHHSTLDNHLFPNRDHALSGEWKDCRDCHIKPDLVLIYKKLDPKILRLVRLGSHSELGL